MAKVLLTGGAGFIGSHIADSLLREGHKVIILDDLSTGKRANISSAAKFYECDLRNRDEVAKIFAEEKPEIISHHAAHLEVSSSVEDPSKDAEVNIIGTLNLLELAVKHKVRHLVFASSAAVYGDGRPPLSEESPINPISPYGIAKASCELYIKNFHLLHKMPYTILRYSNVYGSRQRSDGEASVVPTFMSAMIKKCDIISIFGDGTQTRDYIYVGDIVDINEKILETPLNTILNVGTGVKTPVYELFELIKDISGFDGGKKFAEKRQGDIQDSWLDCTKAREKVGWESAIRLAEGLKKTYGNFGN